MENTGILVNDIIGNRAQTSCSFMNQIWENAGRDEKARSVKFFITVIGCSNSTNAPVESASQLM